MDDTYRDWAVRIQAAQAKYPGYRRLYLQPPAEKDGFWTTFIRYDTTEHLEAWMKAPERRELLKESQAFIERETTFVTMPLSIRWFGWWLFTEKMTPDWVTPVGLGLLAALFAIARSGICCHGENRKSSDQALHPGPAFW